MENSIEEIWKEGFLNEKSLVAPKVIDLYNRKSKHMVDKLRRMFRINVVVMIVLSFVFPVVHYFLGALWQGTAASLLLLLTALYAIWQMRKFKMLEYGVTSLEYLKSFNAWLKDFLAGSEKVMRFTYPLYFLIAISTMWSAWNKGELTSKMYQKYPEVIFIGNVPLFIWAIVGVATLLMFYFSARIYRWDVRLVYGRVFDKLEETIGEMEELKQGKNEM